MAISERSPNGTERVERGRTSVVGGVRADVVREGKRQGCACTRGDRPLGRRARSSELVVSVPPPVDVL